MRWRCACRVSAAWARGLGHRLACWGSCRLGLGGALALSQLGPLNPKQHLPSRLAAAPAASTAPPRSAEQQYQAYHLLLSEVSSWTARLPHAGYRPRLRPAAGAPARLWWRYAAKAVQQQLAARRLTWGQAVRVRSSSL